MFKNLFKKSRAKKDIDQLIGDIAEYKFEEDCELFYKLVAKTKLFCPVDPESVKNLPPVEEYVIRAGNSLKIQAAVIDGLRFAVFFTSLEGMSAGEMYFEVNGIDALKIASETDNLSGALFHNRENSSIRFKKEQIKSILSQYET